MRLPVKIRLGVSGVGSPAMAPEVFYRLTPRDPDDGPPKVYKATIDKVEGTWQVELAPPVGGVAEVFSRYDLGGTLVYSQINCQAAPAHEGSRTDPMGTLPEDWPRLVFPDGPDGMPFWGLMVGQKTDFVLAGPSSEPGKALVAEENGYGPPEPLVSESATGKYSYTATEEEGGQATEARRGGRLAVVTVTPKSGELVTFSLTISRPRTGRNQVPQGLALTGGSAAIAAFGCFAYRRRFKYGDYNKASNKSKGSSKP
jgi:hypothetical protein